MSHFCVFILRRVECLEHLKKLLCSCADKHECGVYFNPKNGLLAMNNFKLKQNDFVFIATDKMNSDDASLLLSYDGMTVNGMRPVYPLARRLKAIQEMAKISIDSSSSVDIYLSDDNPFLPDYISYTVSYNQIADILFQEYKKESISPILPNVHISVKRKTKDTKRRQGTVKKTGDG